MSVRSQPEFIAAPITPRMAEGVETNFEYLFQDLRGLEMALGAAITPVAGGVCYSTSTALGLTAAGTAGQLLQSSAGASPTWTSTPSVTRLTLSGTPTNPTDAATKGYVDGAIAIHAALTTGVHGL